MGGKSGGGSSNTTTVQKADPWAGVQPFLTQGYDILRQQVTGTPPGATPGQYSYQVTPPQFFPGQTVATPDILEQLGQSQQLAYAPFQQALAESGGTGITQLLGGANTAGAAGTLAGTIAPRMYQQGLDLNYQGIPIFLGAHSAMAGAAGADQAFGGAATQGAYGSAQQLGGAGQQFGQDAYTNALNQMGLMGGHTFGLGEIGASRGLNQLSRSTMLSDQMAPGALQAAMSGLGGVAGSGATQFGTAGALSGMQQLLAAGDPASNPFFQQAVQAAIRPVTESFTEQTLPGIRQGAIAAGQMGGSRQGVAEGIAARGYQDTVADITAQMGNQAYAQGLQAMQAGAGIGQGLQAAGVGAAGQLGQLGQGLGQLGLQAGQSFGQLGQGMFGLAGDMESQRLQAGLGLQGQALQAAQLQGQLGTSAADRAAMLQNQIFGGGLNLSQMGIGAQTAAGQLAGGLYGEGMTAAGRGAALLPGVQQALGMPGLGMETIGQQRTADQQAQIDSAMQRWNYEQQAPYAALSDYLAILQGAQGGTTTAMTSGAGGGGSNRLLGGLGGASTGASIGSLFGPMGMGIGAIGGGLLGLFG